MTAPRKEVLAEGVERRVKPCMAKQDFVTIYALCEPVTGERRYVGATHYRPERRLTYHLTQAKNPRSWVYEHALAEWLRNLLIAGSRPTIDVLEIVSLLSDWQAAERKWIAATPSTFNLSVGGLGSTYKRTAAIRTKNSEANRKGSEFSCELCGALFWRKPYAIARGQNRFCSRSCSNRRISHVA